VQQDWPKIAPIMVIATGVRDNGRNTRDLLIDPDSQQTQEAIGTTRQRITQAFATLEPLFDTAEGKASTPLKASGNLRRRLHPCRH
jgi:methyl-accepting chemotaxis protein